MHNENRRTAALVAAVLILASALVCTSCQTKSEAVEAVYTPKVETVETTIVTTEEPEPPLVLLPEAEEKMAEYEHYAGWINIPTVVDEVVVQYTDNDYYIDKNAKTQNHDAGGAIYADYRCLLNTRKRADNIVLYGHNQKDGSRFGQLDFYKWNPLGYYKQQPLVYFDTAYEKRTYKIISMFVINVNAEDDTRPLFDYHNYIDFSDKARYDEFSDQITKRTLVNTGVDFEYGDKFLTLSTCSTEFDNSRFVIVARQLREDESADVDTSKAEKNSNPLYPAIFYKYQGGSYIE